MSESNTSNTERMIEKLADSKLDGPIIGYRRWDVVDGKLKSIGYGDTVWESPVIESSCQSIPHASPDEFCECGLYAYYSLQEEWLKNSFNLHISDTTPSEVPEKQIGVIGIVAGAGQTYLHNNGFRSDKMQILGIINRFDKESSDISKSYSVPLVSTRRELFDLVFSIKEKVVQIPTGKNAVQYLPESVHLTDGVLDSVDDQPAAIFKDSRSIWARSGIIHRGTGPALVSPKAVGYFRNGFCHREDGPAYTDTIYSYQREFYYLDGSPMNIRQWKRDPRVKARLRAKDKV